ncbi:MAG TPA: hypothetical protein VHT91_43590 [Kofleriaceae bacterium]|jgi:hypothetical protein|nr:hypothetical protein [Kofleriaceae bacterium]
MQKRWMALVATWTTLLAGSALLEADVTQPPAVHAPATAVGPVAVGNSFVIEPPVAPFVRELDERERREQVRDWAVLGTIVRLGASPQQAAAATYELPPARLPYLDELYSFEYGRGRRAYLGDRVLLFRDASDPDPVATIGRLADRVRMESGELPAAIEIYVVHDQRDRGEIVVERTPDVSRAALLSSAYGYVEGDAGDPAALADWLSRADDLTYVQISHAGRVSLGGRRFTATRTPNLTVEDIAALYQAHELLNGPRLGAQAKLRTLPPRAQAAAAHLVALVQAGPVTQQAAHADVAILAGTMSLDQAKQTLQVVAEAAAPARDPGFSLDPEWLPLPGDVKHPQFLVALRAFAADPCRELRAMAEEARAILEQEPDDTRRTWRGRLATNLQHADNVPDEVCAEIQRTVSPKIREVAAKLEAAAPSNWDVALAAYYQFRTEWQSRPQGGPGWRAAVVTSGALRFREASSKVQCARYDGIPGTQVGMTLFYTDLLAKLWESTDFGLSAPVVEVPGFLSTPRIDLPAAFRAEVELNPGTRLWFGPRANHVARTDPAGDVRFAFEHRYSRIYAAGTNPAQPGVEVAPGEDSRRTLGWWDRHFDDIADYEPQYHRQNQIMKWSLITAALADSAAAAYLRTTPVDDGATFASWQQAKSGELRFADALPQVHRTIPGRECLPILASYMFQTFGTDSYISGGVSTAGLDAPRAAPAIDPVRPLGSRKPYVSETGGAAARTTTRAHPVLARTKVGFENAARAPTNTAQRRVPLGVPGVRYEAGKTPRELVIRAGQGKDSIGDLAISVERGRVRQRWASGDVERARGGEPATIGTIEAADAVTQRGHAVFAAQAYERLIANPTTPDDIARLALVDAVHGRATDLAAKLGLLEAHHAGLTPGARGALGAALDQLASPAVARRVTDMIERGAPLSDASETVSAVDGRVIVTRDIEPSVVADAHLVDATDLSSSKVYIDGRVLAAHDGLLSETGGSAARWRKVRNVKMSELDASAFGAASDRPDDLPDRLQLPDGRTFDAPPPPRGGATPGVPHLHIHLVEQCDSDHRTATTSDDCP